MPSDQSTKELTYSTMTMADMTTKFARFPQPRNLHKKGTKLSDFNRTIFRPKMQSINKELQAYHLSPLTENTTWIEKKGELISCIA